MKSFFTIYVLICFLSVILISCGTAQVNYTVSATNTIDVEREKETVEILLKDIPGISAKEYDNLVVVNTKNKQLLSQLIDMDQDDIFDRIIFQADFAPKETKIFGLFTKNKKVAVKNSKIKTFCRIVPERIDDFAWENDKVAFRTYGPKCQQLFEEGNSAGLISSGIDCWAKRVDYPIIDSWYKGFNNGKSYHEDHGEGLDAYHVGTTRGCGGIAIVEKGAYVFSKNFIASKVLTNGPIRSIFELKYAPIKINNTLVTETKRITLDLGTHLYHCEVKYASEKSLDTVAIGLALHKNKGKVVSNRKEGWVSYWEPMADSEIGTGIVIDPTSITNIIVADTLNADESLNNAWVNTKIKENSFGYWSGFGWKKSGAFDTGADWGNYLKQEASKKRHPIQIKIAEK